MWAKAQIIPQMGLALWVPHLTGAVFQILTLSDKENGTSHCLGPNLKIHQQVFHAQLGFVDILA